MRRFPIAGLALTALALARLPAAAQSWDGTESLEVRVEDAQGKSVEGAEVALAREAGATVLAFATVPTDGRGRAAIGGLAAGTWQLEVRKPGFMTFFAVVALGDGKPAISSAAHRNVPGAKSPLRVRLGRASGAAPPRPLGATAPAAPPPPSPASPPLPEVAQRSVPEVAPPERPAPPVAAEAAARSLPAAVTPAPVTPAPRPASPPSASPPPSPPAPSAPPIRAAPAVTAPPPATTPHPGAATPPALPPAPTAAPVVPPTPAVPPPLPPSAPARAVVAKEAAVRGCFGCRPGETARALDVTTFAGGEACPADLRARLEAAPSEQWAELADALPSGCVLLPIVLSAADRYTGFRYEAAIPRGRVEDCLPGRDCVAGGCRFLGEPLLRREGGKTFLAAIFESGAERRASFIVYSRPLR